METVNNKDDFVEFLFRIEHTVLTITTDDSSDSDRQIKKLKIQNFEISE